MQNVSIAIGIKVYDFDGAFKYVRRNLEVYQEFQVKLKQLTNLAIRVDEFEAEYDI